MHKSRYTEQQIVGILKESEVFRLRSYAASTGSANRLSTAGRRRTAGWK